MDKNKCPKLTFPKKVSEKYDFFFLFENNIKIYYKSI
jgi:hypothetical protein